MAYGMQIFNSLGDTVIDTNGGPLLSRVRTATISSDKSATIAGATHYGYLWRTTGGAARLFADEIQFVQLPNVNDWVCFWGWELSGTILGVPFINQFPGHWLISNRSTLTIHTFRPVSVLAQPPAGTYGAIVYNAIGQPIWHTDALIARVSAGSLYEVRSDAVAYVTNKVWGNITDPFGLSQNLVSVNPTTLIFSETFNSNPTRLASVVARRTSTTNIQIRNQQVDQINRNLPSNDRFRLGDINAMVGIG